MADQVDVANAWNDLQNETLVRAARDKKSTIEATGACLFCDEPVESPKRWCDVECRNEWERRQ